MIVKKKKYDRKNQIKREDKGFKKMLYWSYQVMTNSVFINVILNYITFEYFISLYECLTISA